MSEEGMEDIIDQYMGYAEKAVFAGGHKKPGWYDEPTRHSLASRGIKTKTRNMSKGRAKRGRLDREGFTLALTGGFELKVYDSSSRMNVPSVARICCPECDKKYTQPRSAMKHVVNKHDYDRHEVNRMVPPNESVKRMKEDLRDIQIELGTLKDRFREKKNLLEYAKDQTDQEVIENYDEEIFGEKTEEEILKKQKDYIKSLHENKSEVKEEFLEKKEKFYEKLDKYDIEYEVV